MSEQAFPLSWPIGQKRTASRDRIWNAPFSVGETKNEEKRERQWNGSAWIETSKTVKKTTSREVGVPLATERLEDQLAKLGADHPILSTNLELRLNGMPRGGQKDPDDPGAAVYFSLKGKRTTLACDKWRRVADNIAALAAHIRAIRSVENFGVGTLEQAFRGYQTLEDFTQGVPWRRVLGFKDEDTVSLEIAESRFRELAKKHHPDTAGGDHLQMAQITEAITAARGELKRAAA